jgi:hypothetical protein
MLNKRIPAIAAVASLFLIEASRLSYADTMIWINDVNTNSDIGELDITTQSIVPGSVHSTGQFLLDIGFIGSTLYGTTGSALYVINKSTGAATLVGNYGGVGAGGMNSLVGSAAGVLFGASNSTTEVYTINPATAVATNFAPSPAAATGDVAFAGTTLYESAQATGGASALVDVNTNSVVGIFHVGGTTIGSVFALTDDGTTLYALSGTEVYSVDLSDAALTQLFNYGGDGLAGARGAAFIGEGAAVVPESSTWAMMLLGFACLSFAGYRASRRGAAFAA